MKNEIFKGNLENVKGTYTNALSINLKTLNSAFEDKSITVEDFRNLVLQVVNGSEIKKTAGQKKFVLDIQRKRTKNEICFLVNNAYLNGTGNGVI